MSLYKVEETGRANCYICGKRIDKGDKGIHLRGWNLSQHHHQICLIDWIKKGVEE